MKALTFCLLIVFSSCSVLNNEQNLDDPIKVIPDKTEYKSSEKIIFTIENTSSLLIQAYGCGTFPSFELQKLVNDNWEHEDGLMCLAIYSWDYFDFLDSKSSKILDFSIATPGVYRYGIALTPKAVSKPPKNSEYTFSPIFTITN